jgi:hypothetical protein
LTKPSPSDLDLASLLERVSPADRAAFLEQWPSLSPAVQAAIVAIVRATP